MIILDGARVRLSPQTDFDFTLTVGPGESWGLIGASGSGKSTLLHMISGFVGLDDGAIHLGGQEHTHSEPAARPTTMVFQSNNLFDHLDVATNVGLGISPHFKATGQPMATVREALSQVGLAGFEHRKPAGLSGGEAQRVALARALVRDKPILLLDEPFAALGPSMRRDFTSVLAGVQRQRHLTMVTVSHAPHELRGLCDRLAFVEGGRIAHVGETDAMLADPHHDALRAYLGQA